jgi:molybdopterin molybdotransferase
VLERARDERADLDAKIALALAGHDVLVVAGGVSVGERDFVKERLAAAGVRVDLWRVQMQPGKPFLYGRAPARAEGNGTHVFGLPGNPVSAFVTFVLFARPAILKLAGAGAAETRLPIVTATAAADLTHRGDRPHYLRGTVDAAGQFSVQGRQESHALFGLSRSNALVRLEPRSTVAAGSRVEALLWG